MGALEVFKVLYSPVTAFKKIVEKPDYKAVLLVIGLILLSEIAGQYVLASRLTFETRTPDDENWTESITIWASDGSLALDILDFMVGNASVRVSASDKPSIQISTTSLGSLDCSGETGYVDLFFWISWEHGNGVPPSSATLQLFSGSAAKYFEVDLTDHIFASTGEWQNITVSLGPESQGWNRFNSDWGNVTGLDLHLGWSAPANVTMKLDGLYFRRYVPPIETSSISLSIIALNSALLFFIDWTLWSFILLIVAKVFGEEVGQWNVFFFIIGYAFMATVVVNLVNILSLSTLPALQVPLDVDFPALINQFWAPHAAYQVWMYLPLIGRAWITFLCAIVIRSLREVTWGKAVSISVLAFVIRFVLNSLGL